MTASPSSTGSPPARRRVPPRPPGVAAAVWDHPVSRYAREVLADRRPEGVLGKLVKAACRRHLRDLVHGPARGLRFDVRSADRVVRFFRRLKHTKGRGFAGRPIELLPWQVFVWGSLCGWKRADGTRRFRTGHIETAKKEGKTLQAAGAALYFTFFDDPPEPGAEGYSAATMRKQAKIVWGEAAAMVQGSPELTDRLIVWGGKNPNSPSGAITRAERNQKFEPLGKDSKGLDGVNPHLAVVDELHALRDRGIWDILDASRGTRPQPLLLAITNTGTGAPGAYMDIRQYGEKVLGGVLEDDSFFAFICGIDKGDRWDDESKWVKAHPGLGSTTSIEYLREQCRKAKSAPSLRNYFRRMHCGEVLAGDEMAFDMDRWKACGGAIPVEVLAELHRRPCVGGLDLASIIDFCALDLFFPPWERDPYPRVLCWFWRPEDTLDEFEQRDNVPYRAWVDDDVIELVPGSSVDFRFLRARLLRIVSCFRGLKYLGFDPWQAEETRQELELEGLKMVKIRQGHATLNAPCRRLEEIYMAGHLRHGGNPLLNWMASNVVWRRDAGGNAIPDKAKALKFRRHIDGISALLTAMACEGLVPPPVKRPYQKRGVRFLRMG